MFDMKFLTDSWLSGIDELRSGNIMNGRPVNICAGIIAIESFASVEIEYSYWELLLSRLGIYLLNILSNIQIETQKL